MYLDPTQVFQLSTAIIGAIIILVAAYSVPLRVSVGILLVLIPFQPIETRLGSANILMTYVLFGALLLRRRLQYVPMLGAMLLILLAYALSISQLPRELYFNHGLHVFFVVSGLLMFVLAYNLAREVSNPRHIIGILMVANVMAVVYCLIQFTVGPGEKMVIFGIDELWMHRNRGHHDPRLVGPFGTPGLTAAYFMTMTMFLVYEILHSNKRRKVALAALAIANVAMILGTANRGSFLVLILSLVAFLFIFRKQLGVMRAIQILVASSVVLITTGILVANHTDFGNMFSRLERVGDFEGGLPDTRQRVWPEAWEVIWERPWLGHGPFLAVPHQLQRREIHPEQLVLSHPHNLYLHLLVTLGMFGTICFVFFLFGAFWRIYQGAKHGHHKNDYERGMVYLGVIVVGGILIDQLKIEFLRHSTMDYAHFVFAVFGLCLGLADRARTHVPRREQLDLGKTEMDGVKNRGRIATGARARISNQLVGTKYAKGGR